MTDQSGIKGRITELLQQIWRSDAFALRETDRTKRLRPEILKRLLGLVMTDDERAADLGLPEGCRVRESAKIIMPENLDCGQHVWIGENAIVDASGGVGIGEHSTIATGVFVWSHTSALSSIMGNNQPGNPYIRRQSTRIGKHSFIGGPSVIYPGVSVGDRVVVLPMSVVTEDVPDNTMVGGAPANAIRKIDEAWIQEQLAALRAEKA